MIPASAPEARELLKRFCGPEVFRSWVDIPFRVPLNTNSQRLIPPLIVPQSQPKQSDTEDTADAVRYLKPPGLKPDYEWTRPQHISLGLFGVIRVECHYRVDSIDDDSAAILVRGTAAIEALESPPRSMLIVESVDLSVSDMSGKGTVCMAEHSEVPESIRFEQKISVEGTGVVRSGKQSHEVRIKQSLTQNWIVSEFEHQDEPQGFPIPGPR